MVDGGRLAPLRVRKILPLTAYEVVQGFLRQR